MMLPIPKKVAAAATLLIALAATAAMYATGPRASSEVAGADVCLRNGAAELDCILQRAKLGINDLDSAGERPLGWDVACLDVRLVREHRNSEAFDGVLDAWVSTLPAVDLHAMAILKATMATSFLLTLPPTSARLASITDRCATLVRWVSGEEGTPGRLALDR